jgi:hypothetical protein
MTSLVDCLDYTTQKGKPPRRAIPPPLFFIEENPTLEEGHCRQNSTLNHGRLKSLSLTAVNDGGLGSGADGAGRGAKGLKLLHDLHGGVISNLAEDDVLAIEPRGDNGGDEELGAVAGKRSKRTEC